jgi:hypothetical protein
VGAVARVDGEARDAAGEQRGADGARLESAVGAALDEGVGGLLVWLFFVVGFVGLLRQRGDGREEEQRQQEQSSDEHAAPPR